VWLKHTKIRTAVWPVRESKTPKQLPPAQNRYWKILLQVKALRDRGGVVLTPAPNWGRSEEHTLVSIEQEARGYRFVLGALEDIISYPCIQRWRSWLRHGGTRQEIQSSMPGESLGNFQVFQPFCPHSAALGHTRPQTQKSTKKTSLGVKWGRRIQRTTLPSWKFRMSKDKKRNNHTWLVYYEKASDSYPSRNRTANPRSPNPHKT
jgi:hypothetical protein